MVPRRDTAVGVNAGGHRGGWAWEKDTGDVGDELVRGPVIGPLALCADALDRAAGAGEEVAVSRRDFGACSEASEDAETAEGELALDFIEGQDLIREPQVSGEVVQLVEVLAGGGALGQELPALDE